MKAILLVLGGAFTAVWAANADLDPVQWYDLAMAVSRCDSFRGLPHDIFCHLDGLPADTTKNTYVDAAYAKAAELIDTELLATFPGGEYRESTLSAILTSGTADPVRIQEPKGRLEELCIFATKKAEDFSIRSETMRISYTTPESLEEQKRTNMLFDIALESISVSYTSKKVAFSSLRLANTQIRG